MSDGAKILHDAEEALELLAADDEALVAYLEAHEAYVAAQLATNAAMRTQLKAIVAEASNGDQPPVGLPALSIADAKPVRAGTAAAFDVNLSPMSVGIVRVQFRADGSPWRNLTFPAGVEFNTVFVETSSPGTMKAEIATPIGATIDRAKATCTILPADDGSLPKASLLDAADTLPGGVMVFRLELDKPLAEAASMTLAIEGTETLTVPVAAGVSYLDIPVAIPADADPGIWTATISGADPTKLEIVRGEAIGRVVAADDPDEPAPDLTRGLLYSRDDSSTAPIDLPPGKLLGMRTVLMITKFDNEPRSGVWEKDIGSASSQSAGQGAFGMGRQPSGNFEAWLVAGGAFVQIPIPVVARKAVAVVFEIDEKAGQARLEVDGKPDARGFGLPIAVADRECADGIGYWAGKRVDPRVGERRAVGVWNRLLSVEERALWFIQRSGKLDAEPDPTPIPPPDPDPDGPVPGDPSPIMPPTGGRIIRVANRAELLAAWAAAQPKDHLIMAPGNYGAVQLQNPKNGVRLEADGMVTWDAGYSLPHAINGRADNVSIVGELTLRRYGPALATKNADGRLTQETAVILADRAWPNFSKSWIIIGVVVTDCPMREGIRLKGSYHEVHNCNFRNLSSVGLVLNNCLDGRVGNCTFQDINTSRGASHHHSGAVKCLGGRKDDGAQGDGWPASKGVAIWKCEGRNLISCRGLLWCDWDNSDFSVDDCVVDGSDYEALALEASARIKIRRLRASNTNRTAHRHTVAFWNSAIMFQNSKWCELADSDLTLGNNCKTVVGVQNWNREDFGAHIGKFYGCNNWWHDCKISGNVLKSHLGNGGPTEASRPKPHPEAKLLAFNNWEGPNFG